MVLQRQLMQTMHRKKKKRKKLLWIKIYTELWLNGQFKKISFTVTDEVFHHLYKTCLFDGGVQKMCMNMRNPKMASEVSLKPEPETTRVTFCIAFL